MVDFSLTDADKKIAALAREEAEIGADVLAPLRQARGRDRAQGVRRGKGSSGSVGGARMPLSPRRAAG